MAHRGFPPVAGPRAEVLILGSFPSRLSLQASQYYANPRNAFWPIIGRILGTSFDVPYATRKRLLRKNRIALWDVVARARRPGSLDSSIVDASVVSNDFGSFFRSHPRIRLVCFNGAKAAELYRRRILPKLDQKSGRLRYRRLPSTSPAHAAMPFKKKLAHWRAVARRRSARRVG
ncbi:MAG: DNA-deoxyinosine glycosylase [Burkholderiales bacterium]